VTQRDRIALIQQVATELDRRGWRDTGTDAQAIAVVISAGGSSRAAAKRVSRQFLASNHLSRGDVERMLDGLASPDPGSSQMTSATRALPSLRAYRERVAALTAFLVVAALILLLDQEADKDVVLRLVSATANAAAIVCVLTAVALVVRGRLGSALGVLVAAAALAVVPPTLGLASPQGRGGPSGSPSPSPRSTPAAEVTASPVSTPSIAIISIDNGATGRSETGILVSVRGIELTPDLSGHLVSVAIGRPGYPTEDFDDLEVGDVVHYDADEAYEIRVISVSTFEAEFFVLQIP
jgi:hypothetical protein